MKYTAKIHAYRLKAILEMDTCKKCPASLHYSSRNSAISCWDFDFDNSFRSLDPCVICNNFIGLDFYAAEYAEFCPCKQLGKSEAIRRSYEALAHWRVGTHPMQEEK